VNACTRVALEDDVLTGLLASPKRLPCRLLYDSTGAELFERITKLDAYYPYRAELQLLDDHLPAIAHRIGASARIIEPGSGAGVKIRRLLTALDRPTSYVAVDISHEQLARMTSELLRDYPELLVEAIAADFTRAFVLPPPQSAVARSVVFFPGSTIGNFEPFDAVHFLRRFRHVAGPGGMLVLGADGTRDHDALVHAYDDNEGVTAAFDKNALAHLNRTRGTSFDLDAFEHRAVWNDASSRIEMHLVSRRAHSIAIGRHAIALAADEPIVTEHAYKHSLLTLRGMLAAAGWHVKDVYTSTAHAMRLWVCEAAHV
jgi:L-histidine Nalpha-methyltransferase